MLLDTANKAVEITLDATPQTNEVSFVVQFTDRGSSTETPTNFCGVTDGTTPVDLVPAPSSGNMRTVDEILIFNADTVARTVKIKLRDNTAYFTMVSVPLINGQSLRYGRDSGWSITPPRFAFVWS